MHLTLDPDLTSFLNISKETSSLFNPEYYGSVFLLPQHIITKYFVEKKYLFSFLQRNEYIFNEIEFVFNKAYQANHIWYNYIFNLL